MFTAVQVTPRPVLTNVALQVPVLAADPSRTQLEADLLKGNLQLTHTRLQLADLVGPPLHMTMHVAGAARSAYNTHGVVSQQVTLIPRLCHSVSHLPERMPILDSCLHV